MALRARLRERRRKLEVLAVGSLERLVGLVVVSVHDLRRAVLQPLECVQRDAGRVRCLVQGDAYGDVLHDFAERVQVGIGERFVHRFAQLEVRPFGRGELAEGAHRVLGFVRTGEPCANGAHADAGLGCDLLMGVAAGERGRDRVTQRGRDLRRAPVFSYGAHSGSPV